MCLRVHDCKRVCVYYACVRVCMYACMYACMCVHDLCTCVHMCNSESIGVDLRVHASPQMLDIELCTVLCSG